MRYIALFIALFLCASPADAKTAAKRNKNCDPIGTMAKRLMKENKLAYLSDAIDDHDRVHMWFVNRHNGDWAELEVYSNLQACIVRKGYDWHFAIGN